jgi:dipeptidase E
MFLGDHVARLNVMAGPNARMAVITNALDYIPAIDRILYAQTQFDAVHYFNDNGFDASLIDLRYYFGRPAALRELLLRYRVVCALGGNAFLLRRAMNESGFDSFITELLDNNGLIYSGWSAGACVAGSSLRGVDLMDKPDAEGDGYTPGKIIWEGLHLVPFTIVPHYRSDHVESASAERAVKFLEAHGLPFKAICDGDVIVKDNGDISVLQRRQ